MVGLIYHGSSIPLGFLLTKGPSSWTYLLLKIDLAFILHIMSPMEIRIMKVYVGESPIAVTKG